MDPHAVGLDRIDERATRGVAADGRHELRGCAQPRHPARRRRCRAALPQPHRARHVRGRHDGPFRHDGDVEHEIAQDDE
jgi:hypothetical protein